MIIGISGKTGTGKSHVAKFLKKKLKFQHIDTQKVLYEVIQEKETEDILLKTFGHKILHKNGSIDRNKLIKVTAQDKVRYKVFQETVNHLIRDWILEVIEESDDNYIIESNSPKEQELEKLFDVSVLVVSPRRIAYTRLFKKFSPEIITNLWLFQKNTKNYDFIIENKTTITSLKKDVDELIAEMFKSQSK